MRHTTLFSWSRHPRGGRAPRRLRVALRLYCVFSLAIAALLWSFPCAAMGKAGGNALLPGKEPSRQELLRQIDPSSWNLSPEAEHLYYSLLLSEGIAENSQIVIGYALKGLLTLDPSLPVFQDSATMLLSRGEFKSAESIAAQGLTHFPDDVLLTLLLAGCYSENGQTAKAIQLLEERRTKSPADRELLEELVRLYLREGQDAKAADLLASIPEDDQTPDARLFRARVLASVGRVKEAISLLRLLLAGQSDFLEAWVELGMLLQRENAPEEAVKALRKAAAIAPGSNELWYRIAMLELELKRPEAARNAMENIEADPSLCIQASLRFADKGYHREAENMLERAAETGGEPDEISLILSMLKEEAGESPLAGLEVLESIPPSSAFYPDALQQKTRIYLQAKQYDKALETAVDARERFPDHKRFWGLESYALVRLKRYEEAERLLTEAVAQFPDDEELLFSLGSVQDESGRKTEALQTMEKLIIINPKSFQALNYVGYTLAEGNRDLTRALSLITTALEQNPEADYIVDSLAWTQYRLGLLDEAWETINRCIKLGGDDATIWEHYGDIALALGKREDAVRGYTESIAREPDNIVEVRKKLSDLKKR